MLDAIRVFLAVVKTGNLSKVAKEEVIAVSSVSRKMGLLKAELGCNLFHLRIGKINSLGNYYATVKNSDCPI